MGPSPEASVGMRSSRVSATTKTACRCAHDYPAPARLSRGQAANAGGAIQGTSR